MMFEAHCSIPQQVFNVAGLPHWEKRNNITTCIFKDNCAKKSIDIRF